MSDLASLLDGTCGKAVTDVIAGGTNGSIVVIEIDRRYLLTIYCAWRLERASTVVTGSNESPDAHKGSIPLETKKLLNDVVESVVLSEFYDLSMRFASGVVLRVFCDVTPRSLPDDYDENWVFCDQLANSCFVVNRNFQVVMSEYRTNTTQ